MAPSSGDQRGGGRLDDARARTESALRSLRAAPASDPDRRLQLLARRARIDLATGRLDDAAEGLAVVERSLAARGDPSNSLRIEVLGDLGVVERLRGDDLRSAAWLSEALELRRLADPAGDDLETHRTARSLAHAWARLGRPDHPDQPDQLDQARELLLDTLTPLIAIDGIDGEITARAAWLLLLIEGMMKPADAGDLGELGDTGELGEPASAFEIPRVAEAPAVDLAALHAVALRARRFELAEVLRTHAGRRAATDGRAMEIRMLLAEERLDEAKRRADELVEAWLDAAASVRRLMEHAAE